MTIPCDMTGVLKFFMMGRMMEIVDVLLSSFVSFLGFIFDFLLDLTYLLGLCPTFVWYCAI